MELSLEHIHLDVDSIEKTEKFLLQAMQTFSKRGGGEPEGLGKWVHIGTEKCYVALTQRKGAIVPDSLRHIGLITDNVDSLIDRMAQIGYQPADLSALDEHEARRRVYFIDENGVSWEFIEYTVDDDVRRNDYST